MNRTTAKHIGEIAGLGLAANYAKNVGEGHPRHPQMEGGLTPRLAPTGDPKHDAAMGAGRFALNFGISWWILLPIWKVYAIATGAGIYLLGHDVLHISIAGSQDGWVLAVFVLWCILQLFYFWACGRIFDGKRVKNPQPLPQVMPRAIANPVYFNNAWGERIPVVLTDQGYYDCWGRLFAMENHSLR